MAVSEAAVILCEGCEDEKAVFFCCQCSHLFCGGCVEQHKKLKAFLSHRIITLAQLEKERAERPPLTCAEDDDSPVTKFCRRCNAFLCLKCIGHEGHMREVRSIAEYAPQVRRELEEAVRGVVERAGELENAGSVAQATAVAVENQRDSLSQTILESFKAAHSFLKEREEALMGEVTLIAEKKTKVLHEQTERLHKASVSLKGLVSATNQQIEKASNESLLQMFKKKIKKLEKSLSEYNQFHTLPDAAADINFSPPTIHLHQLGAVYCNIEPALVTQVPKEAVVSESSEILLRVPQSGDNPSPGDIQVKLASLAHPDKVMNAEVCLHSKENDVFRTVLVPQVRGRHTLTITANGKQIREEPFNIFVNRRISEDNKPVRTFTGFNAPCGVSLSCEGNLIVVEGKGNQLTVVNRESWTRLRTITCEKLSNPTGVAVATDGNIFVCQPHCLLQFNRYRDYLETIGRNGKNPLEFSSPCSVKAMGDELYVCDSGNKRIQILNSYGEFLRAFSTVQGSSSSPESCIPREDGLYVVAGTSICLYSREGVLIRKADMKGFPEKRTTIHRKGACMDYSGNLFVPLYTSNNLKESGVYVFRPTGECITRFGLHSNSSMEPCAVTIDEDGFMYVCYTNKYERGEVYVF